MHSYYLRVDRLINLKFFLHSFSNFSLSLFLESAPEARHSRENSKSGQHSRQGSRDKGNHSRQNSRELLINTPVVVDKPTTKSIEIYATLPKKKTLRSKATAVNVIEDEEYMLYDRTTQRTGLFGRTKRCDEEKKDKKRARSEERNKNITKDFSIAPARASLSPKMTKTEKSKDTVPENPSKNASSGPSPVSNDQKQSKKQHKIRRKLLMGGLIKRKNRSMPDLREGQDGQTTPVDPKIHHTSIPKQSVDDSSVGLKGSDASQALSGYLSEGHLEFSGNNGTAGNPNLERSRLMRKSFHGSAGKVLHVAKVPPPPPLRTTSQLSKSKSSGEVRDKPTEKAQFPLDCKEQPQDQNGLYWNHQNSSSLMNQAPANSNFGYSGEPHSMPFLPSYAVEKSAPTAAQMQNINGKPRVQDDVVQYANGILYEPTYVVTRADVHSEQSPAKQQHLGESLPPYPENNAVAHSRQPSEEFPPPPYPVMQMAATHSRQASEDFPPPPPPINDGEQAKIQMQEPQYESQQISNLLAQLKMKRDQMLAAEAEEKGKEATMAEDEDKASSETWLRELQAKQAERRMKKQGPDHDNKSRQQMIQQISPGSTIIRRSSDLMMNAIGNFEAPGRDVPDCARVVSSSVKDMAARFEQIKLQPQIKPEADVKGAQQKNMPSDEILQEHAVTENPNNSAMMHEAFTKLPQPSANFSLDFNSSHETFVSAPSGYQENSGLNAALQSMSLTLPHENGLPIDYPEDDISEVAMQNTIQNTTILPNEDDIAPKKAKQRIGKKKSVSFCDQVVLVATAEDDEKDSYIPNPILERVLRSAMNKPETAQVLCEIRSLQEAEMNRENAAAPKFQQHTLPLKSEANSVPATPFQDQLRSVNPIHDTPPNSTYPRPNSVETVTTSHPHDGVREALIKASNAYPTQNPNAQQIRYSQNGYLQPLPQQAGYGQVPTQHIRNQMQNVPLSQTQKPASPFPTQIHNQFPQNNMQQLKVNGPKNGYSAYYQLEQQHNQMNKQISAQQQQQAALNQRIQGHTASPVTVQQQQMINYPPNQSPNPYQQQYPQQNSAQSPYPGYPYQSVSYQGRANHVLPQYQSPPHPAAMYQQQQNGYQQRPQQKMEQPNVLAPNQTYPSTMQNGQISSNMKYPAYQHPPMPKQTKQMILQTGTKAGPGSQPMTTLQKLSYISSAQKTAPCHLCRKKQVAEPAIYCVDCDFYMSRFRPKN